MFYFGTLRLKASALLRVINRAKIEIECETLIIDGPLTIDTHGDNGRDGRVRLPFANVDERTSS